MDLLSEILNLASWENNLLTKTNISGRWGYRFPCEKSGGFHIITKGVCYARTEKETYRLEKGDVLFIVKGIHHDILSSPKEKVIPIQEFNEKMNSKRNNLEVNESESSTSFVSIRYEVPDGPQHPFFLELPSIILIKAEKISYSNPIHTTIQMINQEIDSSIGSHLIIQRLTDILLYYSLRHWLESNEHPTSGWVSVFKDDKVLSVLELIHRDQLSKWTIESLANSVGLSRASLAFRFKKSLGMTINDYIVKWKLEKNKSLIHDPDVSLEEVSRKVGYSSAFALSKAYKRIYGKSPRKKMGLK